MLLSWCTQIAKAAGVPVFLDAGGVDAPISPALLPLLSLVSPNETELSRLTGMPTGNEAQVGTPSITCMIVRWKCDDSDGHSCQPACCIAT